MNKKTIPILVETNKNKHYEKLSKTKIFTLVVFLAIFATGCNNDDDNNYTPADNTITGIASKQRT
jgi:hypothetical protein